MCRIQRSYIDYPDGTREPRDVVLNCPRGTPTRPCIDSEIIPVFEDRFGANQNPDRFTGPPHQTANPRDRERSQSRPRQRQRPKGLSLSLRFFNPFASKKPKKRLVLRKEKVRPRREVPASIPYYPRDPTPPLPLPPSPPIQRMPSRGRAPQIIPIAPRKKTRSPSPPRPKPKPKARRGRRRDQPKIIIKQASSSSEDDSSGDDSSSPRKAVRDHQRKSRSLSPRSRFEAEKKYIKEKERRKRVAMEEEQAHQRATKLADHERTERAKEQERLEWEERKRIESAERARRRQQQEEYTRTQAKRRQELADIEAIDAIKRSERRRQEQDRRRREEHERHRIEEEERLQRARRANIPRRPRHALAVHHHQQPRQRESMEDRGERFIREAIRQENLRRFEEDLPRNIGPPRRTYDDGALRGRLNIDRGGRRGGDGWRERRDRRSD